jgi:hypothetical protein
MLEKEFKYYLDHQDELVQLYNGKYIVIAGEDVLGSYESIDEAYFMTLQSHEMGTFLIQYCESGEDAYTESYHSNVYFH